MKYIYTILILIGIIIPTPAQVSVPGTLTNNGAAYPVVDVVNVRGALATNGNGSFLTGIGLTANQSNILASAITNLSPGSVSENEVTTSYLPAPNSIYWQRDLYYPLATERGNEWYMDEVQTGNGYYTVQLPVPVGTTNIAVTFTARSITTGSTAPIVGLWDTGSLASTSPTLTATPSVVSVSEHTGFTNVWLYIIGGSFAISNDLKVTYLPIPTNPVLASAFKRYTVRPAHVTGGCDGQSTYGSLFGSIFPDPTISTVNSHAYVDFITDATNLVLQMKPSGNSFPASVSINGFHYTNITLQSSGTTQNLIPLSFPSTNKLNTVRIYNATTYYRVFPDAIYIPAGNSIQFLKNENAKRLYIFGDSILSSVNSFSFGMGHDLFRTLERYLPFDVLNAAQPNGSLFVQWYQSKKITADAIAAYQPYAIWYNMSYNDWAGNYFGGTNGYETNLTDFVETAHRLSPQTKIFLQTPIPTSTAQPIGGRYLADYSNIVMQVAAAHTGWCVPVNGHTMLSVTNLSDGIHPNDPANVKYAGGIARTLWLDTLVPSGFVGNFTGTFTGNGAGLTNTIISELNYVFEPAKTFVVMGGDSKMNGLANVLSNEWWSMVAKTNIAISGSTLAQYVPMWESNAVAFKARLGTGTNGVYVFWGSHNDIGVSPTTYVNSLSNHISEVIASNFLFVAITAQPRGGYDTDNSDSWLFYRIVGNYLRQDRRIYRIIDAEAIMPANYDSRYFTDSTHLNSDGYNIIAVALNKELQSAYKTYPPQLWAGLYGTNYILAVPTTNGPAKLSLIANANGVTISSNLFVTGSAGIGTTSPATKLQVVGTVRSQRYEVTNAPGANLLAIGVETSSNFWLNGSIPGDAYFISQRPIDFSSDTGTTIAMRLIGNGSLGINTNYPAAKLHVVGNAIVTGGYVCATNTWSGYLSTVSANSNNATFFPGWNTNVDLGAMKVVTNSATGGYYYQRSFGAWGTTP